MAGIRWLQTDTLSNQDISSALAVSVYTCSSWLPGGVTGPSRAVRAQVFVDQVAGGGDYVVYRTLRINGAGSSYVILPKTTLTAAAGETAIAYQFGYLNVQFGDVVTVYVDGLAGDTTTPDTIVRWFEDAALQAFNSDNFIGVDSYYKVAVNGLPASGIYFSDEDTLQDKLPAIKAKTDLIPASPSTLTAAEVNAEVVDALNVDTYAEPGQGAPAATASLAAKIGYLYKVLRNKKTQTATTRSIYNDAGDTVDHKATDSDDGSVFTKGELGTGP